MRGFVRTSRSQAVDRPIVFRGRPAYATRFSLRFAWGIAAGAALLALSPSAYSASTDDYTYDTLGRVTKITHSDGAKTTTVTYSYDATGNRTSVVSTSP
ncbi:RHS repeat domain-containing protein [Burkholderia ambifaria]|uniref:RHS repeat domain-containing protein n=1 Tax=Burkholderia ambifaria TaxID=152480 RepID=UPI001C935981|nr:RHS repeat domain-containing protein [Burkholderia ambifaria]MBY4770929.1 RHS repeat protein [Burkholderia ambifaria]